jgi:hypothetical protein
MERRKSPRLSELRETLPRSVTAVPMVFEGAARRVMARSRWCHGTADERTAGPVVCTKVPQTSRHGASGVQYKYVVIRNVCLVARNVRRS